MRFVLITLCLILQSSCPALMDAFVWDKYIIFQHDSTGQLVPEEIRNFLVESVQPYPSELGSIDLEDWPIKLATGADCFYVRSSVKQMTVALFVYLNDTTFYQGFIPLICVLPHSEKCTGYLLHLSCLEVAKQRGMVAIGLEVLKTNTLALSFYKRAEFWVVENRKNEIDG